MGIYFYFHVLPIRDTLASLFLLALHPGFASTSASTFFPILAFSTSFIPVSLLASTHRYGTMSATATATATTTVTTIATVTTAGTVTTAASATHASSANHTFTTVSATRTPTVSATAAMASLMPNLFRPS